MSVGLFVNICDPLVAEPCASEHEEFSNVLKALRSMTVLDGRPEVSIIMNGQNEFLIVFDHPLWDGSAVAADVSYHHPAPCRYELQTHGNMSQHYMQSLQRIKDLVLGFAVANPNDWEEPATRYVLDQLQLVCTKEE